MAEDIDFVEIEKPDFDVVGDTVFFINLTKGMTEGPLFKAEVPTSAKVVDGITEEALELADMGDDGERERVYFGLRNMYNNIILVVPLGNFGNFLYPLCQCILEETQKSRWSLLYGVYARGSKISHTRGKCVTCRGLHILA